IPEPDNDPPTVESIRFAHQPLIAGITRLNVSWKAADDQGIATQEIWISTDDGRTFRQIVGDLPGGVTSYSWQIPPNIATSRARVKIVARDASVQKGELVSERFSISPARISLHRVNR